MSDVRPYLLLIPGLPLAASFLTALLGPRLLRKHSHWPCIAAVILSCVLSLLVLRAVYEAPEAAGDEARWGAVVDGAAPVARAFYEAYKAREVADDGRHGDRPHAVEVYYPWIQVGEPGKGPSLDAGITLRADALSAMMLVMITF